MSIQHYDRPDGSHIAFEALGRGAPVLLVHGLGSDRTRWKAQVPVLTGRGYRAITLDLRGCGESTSGPAVHGMREYVDDVLDCIDRLKLEGFHLVGHSLGGMLSQLIAVELGDRVASLCLVSTTSHNGERASAFAELMVRFSESGFDGVWNDPVRRAEAEPILKAAFPGVADPPVEMLRAGLEKPDAGRANAWRACKGFSAKHLLVELSCPVMITHGTSDPLIPFRAGQLIHEAIPGSVFFPEEGAGHSLPSSRAESFNAHLLEHLAAAQPDAEDDEDDDDDRYDGRYDVG